MNKRVLILRDSKTKLVVHKEYIKVQTILKSYIIAYIHLEAIYLNKSINMDISTCYTLSKLIKFYLIDKDGYILAQLKGENDEEI